MCAAVQPYPRISGGEEVTEMKDELRTLIRSTRQQRSVRKREEAAQALASVIAQLPGIDDARCIAAYAARPSEPDTADILQCLSARGVEVLLPVLGSRLVRGWALYGGPEDLVQRAPGRPPEPSSPSLGAEGLSRADMIIAPALAVDTHGTRLGQGGGWYDRALAHARPDVPVVALVFPEEIYDAAKRPLPREAHDHPVGMAATPMRWLRLGD